MVVGMSVAATQALDELPLGLDSDDAADAQSCDDARCLPSATPKAMEDGRLTSDHEDSERDRLRSRRAFPHPTMPSEFPHALNRGQRPARGSTGPHLFPGCEQCGESDL